MKLSNDLVILEESFENAAVCWFVKSLPWRPPRHSVPQARDSSQMTVSLI